MTGLAIFLLGLTSYHQGPIESYTQKEFNLVHQLSIKAAKELDHSNCLITYNYYGTQEYFAYEENCQVKLGLKYIYENRVTVVDIKAMRYKRFRETEF